MDGAAADVQRMWASYPQEIPQRAKTVTHPQLTAAQRAGLDPAFSTGPAHVTLVSDTDWLRSPDAVRQVLPQPKVHEHLAPPWVVLSEWLYQKK